MDKKRKIIVGALVIAMAVTLGVVIRNYWYDNTYFVSTEDAKVTGDFVKVTPQISGKLMELSIQEGDFVLQDQVVGQVAAMGNAFLRAPISGLIIKKQSTVGEFVAAGSALALMVDPGKLYIGANIEETKINKIKLGQTVEISIDEYPGKAFTGKVISVGQAANSAFSLLPTTSGSTFTKVVQKIFVKISLENISVKLLPGANAVIKIHVR